MEPAHLSRIHIQRYSGRPCLALGWTVHITQFRMGIQMPDIFSCNPVVRLGIMRNCRYSTFSSDHRQVITTARLRIRLNASPLTHMLRMYNRAHRILSIRLFSRIIVPPLPAMCLHLSSNTCRICSGSAHPPSHWEIKFYRCTTAPPFRTVIRPASPRPINIRSFILPSTTANPRRINPYTAIPHRTWANHLRTIMSH